MKKDKVGGNVLPPTRAKLYQERFLFSVLDVLRQNIKKAAQWKGAFPCPTKHFTVRPLGEGCQAFSASKKSGVKYFLELANMEANRQGQCTL